ncbi:MAG: hypothetical protein APF76_06230 [Desulfitibacter sp. BRH_c19]|nr:MAG: hypothetical protein APF76_06230 [Desulfitibacter sp. BRH_c19]
MKDIVLKKSLKIWIGVLVIGLFLISSNLAYFKFMYNPLVKVEISYAWPEYKGKLIIEDKNELNDFLKIYKRAEKIQGQTREEDVYYKVSLDFKNSNYQLLLNKELDVYNPLEKEYEYSPQLQTFFASKANELDSAFFGEIVPWQDITHKIPKGKVIELRDIEAGVRFNIKRYGGLTHADIEPLDLEDTEVLKSIYGNWNWKRRAVVATIDGKQYAASINGMPHGGGKIWDNEFKGHFCLHFLGSKTHGGGKVDPAHQLMIHKAGGKLPELLDYADPNSLAEYILAALVTEDILPIRYIALENLDQEQWQNLKNSIRYISINKVATGEQSNDKSTVVVVDATVYFENTSVYIRRDFQLEFVLDEIRNSWRLKPNILSDFYMQS